MLFILLNLLGLLSVASLASPVYQHNEKLDQSDSLSTRTKQPLPFNKIVAFGDDFTDDGSGSYAHGITGNPKTGAGKHMWGHNTFTDGLVAVSYLSKKLNIPISYNYAWGSAGGAQVIGSVCQNSAIAPNKRNGHAHYDGKLVPAAHDQVANYTQSKVFTNDIANTLHFFWTGNNDMIASLGWAGRFTLCILDTLCLPGQQRFIKKLIECFRSSLMTLVRAGAKHILVPNVYPRELTPWTTMWITQSLGMIGNFGSVVDEFNAQLEDLVNTINSKHGTNIMLYDVNGFIKKTLNKPKLVEGAGYTNTCVDSCNIANPTGISNWNLYWNHTVVHKKPDLFYWMTEIMPSTTVHKKIARDMKHFLHRQTY